MAKPLHRHIKYWIKPDIENRIKNKEITAYLSTTVTRIDPDTVTLRTVSAKNPAQPGMFDTAREFTIPNQFVFALTGYQPDFTFMESLGVRLDADNARCPVCNRDTLESNVPGIYLAGVIVAGERTNEIFIENGRFHGALIAKDLSTKLRLSPAR